MISDNGNNRVLDIYKNGGVVNGCNVDIWSPNDPEAQKWIIQQYIGNSYKIISATNPDLVLTAYGSSNGTGAGNTATSEGNVYVSTYTGSTNQIWSFETKAESPTGYLDGVYSDSIQGWAWRSDIPNEAINVHIYLVNTTTDQQWIYNVVANKYRSDLYAAGYGNGYHGFHINIDWREYPPGTYSIYAYGIGANGDNPMLSNSPKNYNSSSSTPYGKLELVRTTIEGWAWRSDMPNTSIDVQLIITNTTTNQQTIYNVTANDYRSDLYNKYGYGYHGFSYDIDWDEFAYGTYRVNAYGVTSSGNVQLPNTLTVTTYNEHYDEDTPISSVALFSDGTTAIPTPFTINIRQAKNITYLDSDVKIPLKASTLVYAVNDNINKIVFDISELFNMEMQVNNRNYQMINVTNVLVGDWTWDCDDIIVGDQMFAITHTPDFYAKSFVMFEPGYLYDSVFPSYYEFSSISN